MVNLRPNYYSVREYADQRSAPNAAARLRVASVALSGSRSGSPVVLGTYRFFARSARAVLSSEAPPCSAADILVGTAGVSRIQHAVQRAAHAGRATVQDVRVDLRRRHVTVTQEFLDGPDVAAVLEQVRCERVTQRVGAGPLGDPGAPHRLLHCALQDRLVQVMAGDARP